MEDKPLIRDFNLEVNPGEMVAIVGPTGAGKTTLINLLMRFYDVTKGAITVDGHDIRDLPRQDYRKQFGMVLQDAWLYEGTIKENLRFGKNLMKGRTSFVIAHRLSTIQEADKILVLKEGQIIEQGNHESLLAAKGFYYDLYMSQFSKKVEAQ